MISERFNCKTFFRCLRITGIAAFLLGQASVSSALPFVTGLTNGSGALPIAGNQAYWGTLGDDFTANTDLQITQIGVFDDDGDGTIGDLYWEIFNVSTGALLHSQTVAATGARTVAGNDIEDNYIWATLINAITLSAGETYSVVASGFDAIDRNFNTNFNLAALAVDFNTADITSGGGRWGFPAGTLPGFGAGNSQSTQRYNFGAATFNYAAVEPDRDAVPEPATLSLFILALLGIGVKGRRNSSVA